MAKGKKPPKKKQARKTGILPVFLLLIFLGSLGACGYLLWGEINKEIGIKDMEADIQTFMKPQTNNTDTSTETEPDADDETSVGNEGSGFVFDWDGMKQQSEYVIGWIQMPGIERINYPIVQHPEDNQYFLTHDWKGASQSAGAIFMNRYNTPDFTDMNTVIYGHRMKSGSMFGLLKQYENQSFMDENPYFYIYTPAGEKLTYEIICCSYVTDGSDAYLQMFNTPNERMAYYDMMTSPLSSVTGKGCVAKRDVEVGKFDCTIMFSTCGKSGSGYYDRVVVLGKLIEVDPNGQTESWIPEEQQ